MFVIFRKKSPHLVCSKASKAINELSKNYFQHAEKKFNFDVSRGYSFIFAWFSKEKVRIFYESIRRKLLNGFVAFFYAGKLRIAFLEERQN